MGKNKGNARLADVVDVASEVQGHLNRWNPAPTDNSLSYIVGSVPDEGDGRATAHVVNPLAATTGDNQIQYGDDAARGDGSGEGDGDEDGQSYDDMTVDELKDALRERDLPVSGSKQELIDRLSEDDG